MFIRPSHAVTLLAVALLTTSQGCSTSPRGRSEKAVGTLDSTRAELADAVKQLDKVLGALNQIESQPPKLTPVYKQYVSELHRLEGSAKDVGERVRDMRVRAADYSTQWYAANETISNPELRIAADQRAELVRSRYAAIDQQAQDVRAAYEPLITELRDLETFLSHDLTYAGVISVKPVFDSARKRADLLKAEVNEMVRELDQTYTRLSPTTKTAK